MILFPDELENFRLISVLSYAWDEMNAKAAPRPYHALSFRVNGDCVYRVNGEETKISSHDLLFVPNHLEYMQIRKKERLIIVHFTADNLPEDKIMSFTPSHANVFEALFSSLYESWTKRLPGYMAESISYFYKILSKIQIQQNKIEIADYQSSFKDALEYLHENFTDPNLTVKEIAHVAAFSESHFRKQFKELKGASPIQYITDLRTSYALELLHAGYYKIYEIAEKSGFSDSKYFSTVIRKKTGFSPKELQRKYSNKRD